jgi:hypothetical protein
MNAKRTGSKPQPTKLNVTNTFDGFVTDPDDALRFAASGLPAGAALHPSTGAVASA